jgi:hypothetical protein
LENVLYMKSKHPLLDRLNLKVTQKLETNFDTTEKTLVNYIIADELEAKLQASKKLFYNKAGSLYSGFRTERQPTSTFAGLLIGETELVHCEKHEPIYTLDPITRKLVSARCERCNLELTVSIGPKETE